MNSTELKDKFRLEVFDTVVPYLWSDEEIFEYMDDAQKMFCRYGEGIPDSTSVVTQISYAAGDIWAPLDERILKIRKASLASNYRNVELANFEDIGHNTQDDYKNPIFLELDDSTGDVSRIVLGMEQDQIRLVKIPTVADTINLIVFRLPMDDITADGQDLEIHRQHHVHLLHWMKHRAYSKHDSETFNKGKAEEFGAAAMQYFEKARVEQETRKHKHRAVSYGGY